MIAFQPHVYEPPRPPSMLPPPTARHPPSVHSRLASPPWTEGEILPPSTPALPTTLPGTLPESHNSILGDGKCLRIGFSTLWRETTRTGMIILTGEFKITHVDSRPITRGRQPILPRITTPAQFADGPVRLSLL